MGSASNAVADQSFWQFSDQLRLQTAALAGLSIGDSIWSSSDNPASAGGAASFLHRRRPEERRNLDFSAPAATAEPALLGGGDGLLGKGWDQQLTPIQKQGNNGGGAASLFEDLNGKAAAGPFGWKAGAKGVAGTGVGYFNKEVSRPALGGGYLNKDLGSKPAARRINENFSNDDFFNPKGNAGVATRKKSSSPNNNGNGFKSNNSNDKAAAAADKRFKTLPASEALPRSEAVGGYIFVCNNDTMPENLQRQLFGLPSRYRDSVRQITPGLPLFLYNYSTHQLHGIFQAASFGGTNIDPTAWEDKKCPGESRFPAQVRAKTKRIYVPLEEDAFRPILHHYDGPKFRLELSVPEALALLDKFEENSA